jgi:tRNA(Ile)-lysidine synthase
MGRWRGLGVVVAVSGGADSVALLRILHLISAERNLRLSVAHLNHGVRGEASEADARFVAELAATLALPFDLGHWSPRTPGNFEADARQARYAWLAKTARDRGASVVAVGHTRDDQAETILHRILRGTGLRGLAGIPARRRLTEGVTLIRPFLTISRLEINAYLAETDQNHREDATNADNHYTRARIRHDLLPKLAVDYNPRVVEALTRLGRLAGASDHALRRRLVEQEQGATIRVQADSVLFRRELLAALPLIERAEVLRLAWNRQGWPEAGMSARRWERLAKLARSSQGRLSIGGGFEAVATPERFEVRRGDAEVPVPDGPTLLDVPGSTVWEGIRITATIGEIAPRQELIDLDCLAPPLWVGPPNFGDRFEPLGMDGRGMRLGDFLRGARRRETLTPVVRDEAGIVWVVGVRIAHRVRRTDATRNLLSLNWEPIEP